MGVPRVAPNLNPPGICGPSGAEIVNPPLGVHGVAGGFLRYYEVILRKAATCEIASNFTNRSNSPPTPPILAAFLALVRRRFF